MLFLFSRSFTPSFAMRRHPLFGVCYCDSHDFALAAWLTRLLITQGVCMSHHIGSFISRVRAPAFSNLFSSRAMSRLVPVALTLCAFALLALQMPAPVVAQTNRLSVESLLRPDGTLNLQAGVSGAFDLQRWRRGPGA